MKTSWYEQFWILAPILSLCRAYFWAWRLGDDTSILPSQIFLFVIDKTKQNSWWDQSDTRPMKKSTKIQNCSYHEVCIEEVKKCQINSKPDLGMISLNQQGLYYSVLKKWLCYIHYLGQKMWIPIRNCFCVPSIWRCFCMLKLAIACVIVRLFCSNNLLFYCKLLLICVPPST